MSGFYNTTIRTPTQASDIFSQSGRFPKQKQSFLVRFILNSGMSLPDLTFVVKTTDRPSITLTTQELTQYNKKRVVYTGYKTNPVNVTFYDSADQSAQSLWMAYSQYYFGDFAQNYTAYNDDIENSSTNWIGNLGTAGFGYTANNGGQTTFGSQYFIKYIEIVHFANNGYDTYTLINPKITNYDLDNLDYSAADISTVTMTFTYEAALYSPGTGGASSTAVPELESGLFNGHPLNVDEISAQIPTEYYVPNAISDSSITSSILGALYGGAVSNISSTNYNYYNTTNGSGLGIFGNFVFGVAENAAIAATSNSQVINNPALAAILGASSNPYGVNGGISANLYDTTAAIASSATSNSEESRILTDGILSSVISGNSNISYSPNSYGSNSEQPVFLKKEAKLKTSPQTTTSVPNGLLLSDASLGMINSSLNGTAQYGYNPQVYNGNNYGYQGTKGLVTPTQPFGNYVSPVNTNSSATTNTSSNIASSASGTLINNGSNVGTVVESSLNISAGEFISTNNTSTANYIDPTTGITYNF